MYLIIYLRAKPVPEPALIADKIAEMEWPDAEFPRQSQCRQGAVQLTRTIKLAADWAILDQPSQYGGRQPLLLSQIQASGAIAHLEPPKK
jgi:hypothetical protein